MTGAAVTPADIPPRVYEPGSRSELHPLNYIRALWKRRRLMVTLARTRLKAGNFNTVLGQAWLVLGPLAQAAVYVILIGILRGRLHEPGRIQLIVVGLFLFTYTRTSVQRGSSSLTGNDSLLLNASLPRAILPMTAVVEAFMALLSGLAVYAIIHVATGQEVGPGLLAFPLLLAIHTLFNLGAALLLSMATVYIPDVRSVLGYLLRLWMYMTPVLYPVDFLRGNLDAFLAILRWNPLWYLFDAYHRVLFDGTWPTATHWLISSAWTLGFLVVGYLVFASKERYVAIRA